jgi:hypothetical protein
MQARLPWNGPKPACSIASLDALRPGPRRCALFKYNPLFVSLDNKHQELFALPLGSLAAQREKQRQQP